MVNQDLSRQDDSGNITATRIASWNVNNTGELMCRALTLDPANEGAENYNAYNEVRLVGGIYEVCAGAFRSAMFRE